MIRLDHEEQEQKPMILVSTCFTKWEAPKYILPLIDADIFSHSFLFIWRFYSEKGSLEFHSGGRL